MGGRHPDEWRGTLSWIDPDRAIDLAELYKRYVELRTDSFWHDVLFDAVRYYIHANEPDPVNLALVITQAAFELLAWSILKERTGEYSRAGFKRLDAADKLIRLADLAGIATSIPTSLVALHSTAARRQWASGPEAITTMRNAMTHPTRTRMQEYDHDSWVDAWLLSQTYLELLLLRLMSYGGRYMSRMPDASRWAGSSILPPWRP